MALSRSGVIWCGDERRSGILRDPAHPLNGIDFVEFRRDPLAVPERRFILDVTFLKPPPAVATLSFAVQGGVRIVDVRVLDAEDDLTDPLLLHVFVDREGDFSTYVLSVDGPDIDEERSQAAFSFKAGCPTLFDCRPKLDCPPPSLPEPALDYLAKDYQSFRRLLLDLIAARNPRWEERLPADLGITLVELLAYVGDYLSYYQDAGPATEGYLDTCLHRISAARHATLIDYRMHNGRNAVSYVHFRATAGTDGVVPAGAKLVTRIGTPLIGETAPPGPVIDGAAQFDSDPALADATVFETTALASVDSDHNELRIHTWGDAECCLARGTREAYLFGLAGGAGSETAFAPHLAVGDYLLLEEVRSPVTAAPADADPKKRQVVRLVEVESTNDEAFTDAVPGGVLTPRLNPAVENPLPLQRVVWREADGLAFTLCLSAETPEAGRIDPVSVARGNVAPADHGITLRQEVPPPEIGPERWPLPLLTLPNAPVTHQAMPDEPDYTASGQLLFGRHELERDARETMPGVVLVMHFPGGEDEIWAPMPHLLDSGAYDQHFVAEIDNDGRAILRFGDDQYGRRPLGAIGATARYRIGNGRAGNIGAGALVHVVEPDPTEPLDPSNPGAPLNFADVEAVYQPLPARLGTDPESIEQVRQLAPEAFRAIQFRAVTEADWEEVALRHEAVAAAKAQFRWTGSWHTVFVAIHPRDERHLVRLAGGGVALEAAFAASMKAYLTRFKLAGYDLRVNAAVYVPLEIAIRICVARYHFRGDVLEAVSKRLSNRSFADGSRGFFHPLEFVFGQPVYLSRLYAAIMEIEGVDSAEVLVFKRYWEVAGDELERGLIEVGPFEIPRLDNDRNFPENGVLTLTAVGGQ
ncbi:MAG: hypothetical protein AB7P52_03770 [Alphaproteobacteria bacterium]